MWPARGCEHVHDLRLESKVRRDGCQPGARGAAVARGECAPEETRRGSEPRQRCAAVGNSKKRMELTAMKAAVEHLKQNFAFSERRACQVLRFPVSTFRYRSVRRDDELRERLVDRGQLVFRSGQLEFPAPRGMEAIQVGRLVW